MGDIATIRKGKQLNRSHFIEGKYPVINGGKEPSGYHNKSNCSANNITMSEGGESAGYVDFQKEDFWLGGHCYAIMPLDARQIKLRFLFQCLKEQERRIRQRKDGAALPNLNRQKVTNILIPIPPLPVQEQIVAILDRFDALLHDLNSGLPAEIKARRQQYEYYREKLLTFKALPSLSNLPKKAA